MARGGARPGAGRKIGQKAAHTLDAAKGKALLIQMYLEQIRPINQALIDKALSGDIGAIKELHDRVYDKARQPIDGKVTGELTISIAESVVKKHVNNTPPSAE
jgi:hypothetical protein